MQIRATEYVQQYEYVRVARILIKGYGLWMVHGTVDRIPPDTILHSYGVPQIYR